MFLSELLLFHTAAELRSIPYHYLLDSRGQLVGEDSLDQLDRCGFVVVLFLVHRDSVHLEDSVGHSLSSFDFQVWGTLVSMSGLH